MRIVDGSERRIRVRETLRGEDGIGVGVGVFDGCG